VSQPDPTTTPPADGANALLAAAEGTGGRRVRYTPKAKKPPTAAPQQPAEKPEEAPGAEDTSDAASTPQEAAEPVEQTEAPQPPTSTPAPPAPDAPRPDAEPTSENTTNSTTDVAFPATPLRFESVFSKPVHDMDPEMFAMFRQRQDKILKSLANIVNMFLDRKDEYEKAVRTAVAAGFPKGELAKLAVQYDCGPFLEAVLGELPQQ
jgi:outer membrane biosynthesis protein TonB